MKCLEKDRTRRYETANGVAQDLERHLHNEPITARPPSKAYRFQKMVRRNKLAFAAAGAVTAALVIGLGVSIFLFVKESAARKEMERARESERQQRQQADAARAQAEGLVRFMMQDLQPVLTQYGRLPLLKQVVEKAIEYFDGLPADLRDIKTEFGRADSLEAHAEILLAEGNQKDAEAEFARALAVYQRIEEKNPENPEAPAAVLLVQQGVATLDRTQPSAQQDAFQQRALHRWRQLYERYPTNQLVTRGLIQSLLIRGAMASYFFNKPEDAIAASEEASAMLHEISKRFPDNKFLNAGIAQSKTALAGAYDAAGQREKSVQLSEEASAYFNQALKEDPGNLTLIAGGAEVERYLSYRISAVSQKRARDAELVARERFHLLTQLDPSNAHWRQRYAMTHMMECYYLQSDGQVDAARQAFRKFDSLLEPISNQLWDQEKLFGVSTELARMAAAAGDSADARAQLVIGEKRFQTYYHTLFPGSYDRLRVRIRWEYFKGRALLTMRDWPALAESARTGLAAIEQGFTHRPGDSELRLRRAVLNSFLGVALLRQGNVREAIPPLEQSVADHRDAPPAAAFTEDRESFAAFAAETLADALAKTGDTAQAMRLLESTLAIHEAKLAQQPDNWELQQTLANNLVLQAEVLTPVNAESAARRLACIDRAAAILNRRDTASLTADDKEMKARIENLRATAQSRS
jgi:tetratricopeptide (TPR) repeat protein